MTLWPLVGLRLELGKVMTKLIETCIKVSVPKFSPPLRCCSQNTYTVVFLEVNGIQWHKTRDTNH
jgi:hypothetical protein